MAKFKAQVIVDGQLIAERKTEHEYVAAVVVERKDDGKLIAYSFHGSQALALKRVGTLWAKAWAQAQYARVFTAPVVNVPVESRDRVRCAGLKLVTGPEYSNGILPLVRAVQCTKDATRGDRCADHAATDNAAVGVEAGRLQDARNAEWQRRWRADHAAAFTAATCPIIAGRCEVHSKS